VKFGSPEAFGASGKRQFKAGLPHDGLPGHGQAVSKLAADPSGFSGWAPTGANSTNVEV